MLVVVGVRCGIPSSMFPQFLLPNYVLCIMCVHTYIHTYWPRVFVIFQEIFRCDARNLPMYHLPQCFTLSVTYGNQSVLAETVFCCFLRNTLFT